MTDEILHIPLNEYYELFEVAFNNVTKRWMTVFHKNWEYSQKKRYGFLWKHKGSEIKWRPEDTADGKEQTYGEAWLRKLFAREYGDYIEYQRKLQAPSNLSNRLVGNSKTMVEVSLWTYRKVVRFSKMEFLDG